MEDGLVYEILEYELANRKRPYVEWLKTMDGAVRLRLINCVYRLQAGNLSNVKSVGDGVYELRVDSGPGYRIYFGRVGNKVILLLAGGTKRRQQLDIERAKVYLQDYIDKQEGTHASITFIRRNNS